jgi:Tol biopolymer transport system component
VPRLITTGGFETGWPRWSPDGRWIAYLADRHRAVKLLEVATGREVQIAQLANFTPSFMDWSSDSKRLFYLDSDPSSNTTGSRRTSVFESEPSGTPRLVREVTFRGAGSALSVVNDTSLIIKPNNGEAVTIAPLRGAGPEVQLLAPNSGWVSVPIVSADGHWVAFRRNLSRENDGRFTKIDVMQLDGTNRKTLDLPFVVARGENPLFLPGNQQIIVSEGLGDRVTEGADPGLYLVTLSTGAVKKLVTVSRKGSFPVEWSLSPDGKTILYLNFEQVPVNFGTLDLAPLIAKPKA